MAHSWDERRVVRGFNTDYLRQSSDEDGCHTTASQSMSKNGSAWEALSYQRRTLRVIHAEGKSVKVGKHCQIETLLVKRKHTYD